MEYELFSSISNIYYGLATILHCLEHEIPLALLENFGGHESYFYYTFDSHDLLKSDKKKC
jgi:hypothetical protein